MAEYRQLGKSGLRVSLPIVRCAAVDARCMYVLTLGAVLCVLVRRHVRREHFLECMSSSRLYTVQY